MKIFDFHCDTLMPVVGKEFKDEPFSLLKNNHALDFEKMKKGDYLAQFFAVCVLDPQSMNEFTGDTIFKPYELANQMIEAFERELETHSLQASFAKGYDDIVKNREEGRLSALLALEGAGYLDGDMERFYSFFERGVRLITLTWNYENCIAFPQSSDPDLMAKGLKPFGYDLLAEMNRLGVIIDVSHLSDQGFWDCIDQSKDPIVASHSNSRHITGATRNLSDKMLRALADKGGIAGLNFCPAFLQPGQGFDPSQENQKSRVKDMISHINHMQNVGGIDCVALGSDLDGIGGDLEIDCASKYPLLIEGLEKEGYTTGAIEKIAYKNGLRVIKEICS